MAVISGMYGNSISMASKALDFLWEKESVISNNLANVETPGYKAKYVTFEESLRQAIQSAADNSKPTTSMRQAIAGTEVTHHQAEESTRMDDNGVNITEQMVELVREGYQMQYVMNAISSDFSLLRSAINGLGGA